jgi:hypothetical protein
MKKKLLTIALLLLWPSVAGATNYYVREDGTAADKSEALGCMIASTAMSPATASSELYSSDDVIYLCNDGGDISTQITITSSGTAGHSIVYDGQPSGQSTRTIIDRNGGDGDCLYGTGKNNITVRNLVLREAANHGLHLVQTSTPAVTGITVTNVDGLFNGLDGAYIEATSVLNTISGIRYSQCNFSDNGKHGADIKGNWSDVQYSYVTANRNGSLAAGHGLSSHPHVSTTTTGWTLVGGTIYSRSVSNDTVQKVIDRTGLSVLAHNDGAYATLASGEWDQNSTTLYVNIGSDPEGKTLTYIRGAASGIIYDHCTTDGNVASVAGEGHGIAFDDGSNGCTVRYCTSRLNDGAGWQNKWGDNNTVEFSFAKENALSGVRTTGYHDNFNLYNLTLLGNTGQGVNINGPASDTSIYNVLAVNNTLYGIAGYAGLTAEINTYNSLTYGNGAGSTNNVTNTGLITTTDPLLDSAGRPSLKSLYDAGTTHDNIYCGSGEPIGAYELCKGASMPPPLWFLGIPDSYSLGGGRVHASFVWDDSLTWSDLNIWAD